MTFTVHIPFGPFNAGDTPTAAEVLARVPGADLDWLTRKGSLVPPPGHAAALAPAPVTPGEAELVAALQAKFEAADAAREAAETAAAERTAERDALQKRVAELEAAAAERTAERDALQKRVAELEAAAAAGKKPKP